ncbi:MAG: hypothetical protein CVU86_06205 [Firmicutes bacterium HGW-Firmicutes-11]|jgi:diguanylate cyclase (GGDEF)-like protein/PAS domain S-box-containing protein|nr:MAG: hypothetical protein CVU86_06205 [Firmicutes bacterium HGW-Firmicutes-11]
MRNRILSKAHLKYGLLISAFLILSLSLFSFTNYMQQHVQTHAEEELQKKASFLSATVSEAIKDQSMLLAPLVGYARSLDDFHSDPKLRRLMLEVKRIGRFTGISLSDKYGVRTIVGDVPSETEAFLLMGDWTGDASYSTIPYIEGGRRWILFTMPILSEESKGGRLYAVMEAGLLEASLRVPSWYADGFSNVLTSDGRVALTIGAPVQAFDTTTVMEGLANVELIEGPDRDTLLSELAGGGSGSFTIRMGESIFHAYYTPVIGNDWMLVTTTPREVFLKDQKEHWNVLILSSLGSLVVMLLLASYIGIQQAERRKEAEERARVLAISEQRFRLLSSLSENIIYELNTETSDVIFPNGFKKIIGYPPPKEDFPKAFARNGLIHQEDKARFLDAYIAYPTDEDKRYGEYRLLDREGQYRWFRFEELLLRDEKGNVIRIIGRMRDIDEEKKRLESLQAKSRIDPGSGAFNKGATEYLVGRHLEQDYDRSHAVLVLDIDDFKLLNDQRGHLYGDQIIRHIVAIVRESLRTSDLIGRIGGDEFLIFIQDVPGEAFVASKTMHLLKTIQSQLEIGISIGIGLYPEHGKTFDELYHAADTAMYKVKNQGKSGFAFCAGATITGEDDGTEQLAIPQI